MLGRWWVAAFCLVWVSACRAAEPPTATYAPTSEYKTRLVKGWEVMIHRDLLTDQPELAAEVLDVLEDQLVGIERMVPRRAVERLKQVMIWVEEQEPHHPCMCYHPGAGWLREHDMNPDKARCVEIANARKFLKWTKDQPWMVLHELAHAYHHQFVPDGYENEEVKQALESARAERLYDGVLRIQGKVEPAYGGKNPMEYFAEGSEALFGTNDFYPFVRAELEQHDPRLYRLLEKLWNGDGVEADRNQEQEPRP